MKRAIAAMMVLATSCCLLAACGSSPNQSESPAHQESRAAVQQNAAADSAVPMEKSGAGVPGAGDAKGPVAFTISAGDVQLVATLADTGAARALAEQLRAGPISLSLHAYGGFEKVGLLPWGLPTSDEQITTQPGDIMLYQGSQMTIFTGSNSWAYTPLGHIEGATSESLAEALGDGDVEVTLSLG